MSDANSTNRYKVSVVIPTCDDAPSLQRALRSIAATGYEALDVVVVENRPPSPRTRDVAEHAPDGLSVRYVEEYRKGSSWARNAGLAVTVGDLVAFVDDDVVVASDWLDKAIAAFDAVPDASCVTGRIRPLTLDFAAERLFDQFAALDKGAERRVFRLEEIRVTEPLFPYAAGHIGSGANIVVRHEVAQRLGGFDPMLGAGTPAVGGEDLDLFVRFAYDLGAIVYDPAVVVWHEHPRDMRSLRRHAYHYGIGLTAMVTKQLHRGPERRRLLHAIPAGLRYALDPKSRKNAQKTRDYPKSLDWLEWLGMAVGPFAYLASAVESGVRRRAF